MSPTPRPFAAGHTTLAGIREDHVRPFKMIGRTSWRAAPEPPSHRAAFPSFSRSRQCQTPHVRSENERDPTGAPIAALGRCPAGRRPQAKVPAQECSAPAAQEVSSRCAPRHRPDPQGSLDPADASLLPRPQACVRARMQHRELDGAAATRLGIEPLEHDAFGAAARERSDENAKSAALILDRHQRRHWTRDEELRSREHQ